VSGKEPGHHLPEYYQFVYQTYIIFHFKVWFYYRCKSKSPAIFYKWV